MWFSLLFAIHFFENELILSLSRSQLQFSLLSAIQFLLCNYGEFSVESTNYFQFIFFFILITCLLDISLILQRECLSWSLIGVKRLRECATHHVD